MDTYLKYKDEFNKIFETHFRHENGSYVTRQNVYEIIQHYAQKRNTKGSEPEETIAASTYMEQFKCFLYHEHEISSVKIKGYFFYKNIARLIEPDIYLSDRPMATPVQKEPSIIDVPKIVFNKKFDEWVKRCFFVCDGEYTTYQQMTLLVQKDCDAEGIELDEFILYLKSHYGVLEGVNGNGAYFLNIAPKIGRDVLNIEKSVMASNSRFFITSAHAAAPVHAGFLDAIYNWCKRNDAELIVLPAYAHVRALQQQPTVYDPTVMRLADHFATSYTINDNLLACDLKLLPQQIFPLTGMDTMFRSRKSIIVASPKQHLQVIPTSCSKLPRALMSTGACTEPMYQENRIGGLAEESHIIGGVIVEVDDKFFHARHVQAYEDGSFIDIALSDRNNPGAIKYLPSGDIERIRPEGLVLGDIHSDLIDMEAYNAARDVMARTMPREVVLHDLHDANTETPHHIGDAFQTVKKRFFSLRDEMNATKQVFDMITRDAQQYNGSIVVVFSNHDDMLARYLKSFRWKDDAINIEFAAELFLRQLRKGNALQSVVDPDNTARWLTPYEDYFIGDKLVSNHGHLGINGSKGNIKQLSRIRTMVKGHTHVPATLGGTVQVGCMCTRHQDYIKGYNGQLASMCLLYPDNKFSHILVLDGRYTID
jgi:hypothetical protein